MSVTSFSVALDIYTEEFTGIQAYRNLKREGDVNQEVLLQSWRDNLSKANITTGWTTKHAKMTQLTPLMDICHTLIGYSLTGKNESGGSVSMRDLYILHQLHEQVPIHLGWAVV
ncbi:unnamed protein product [Linum trigynum]|uniref:Uncharacterized protein n=1 Tax=Linum trigynum TaxID=586398 RepID=A0AAV2F923_9ROSI